MTSPSGPVVNSLSPNYNMKNTSMLGLAGMSEYHDAEGFHSLLIRCVNVSIYLGKL